MQLVIVLVCLLTTGCATLVGDGDQLISVNTSPDGAAVVVTDEHGVEVTRGTTPLSLTLEKGGGYFDGKDYTLQFSKEGYQSQVLVLESETNNWYLFGNIVFGGLVGWLIVDPLSGAMWKFEPELVSVSLAQAAGPTVSPVQP